MAATLGQAEREFASVAEERDKGMRAAQKLNRGLEELKAMLDCKEAGPVFQEGAAAGWQEVRAGAREGEVQSPVWGEADRGGDEGAIAAVLEAAEGGSDYEKCGSFAGALPGFSFKLGKEDLAYYREAAGVASGAEEVPTNGDTSTFVVKPSPSASLWDDLD